MKTRRRSALVAGALALSLGLGSLTASAASSAGLPDRASKAGDYLASKLIHKTINGQDTAYIAYSGRTPNLSLTAEAIVAFNALGSTYVANRDLLLGYLEAKVEKYVHVTSGCGLSGEYDDAGHLGLVLYLATLTGTEAAFHTSDLRARLLATQRWSGSNTGLFGLNSPKGCYDGVERTALAIIGLMADGVGSLDPAITTAKRWIENQQCADGGFASYHAVTAQCVSSGYGANRIDTNSTAYAILAMVATGASSATGQPLWAALNWTSSAQKANGSWGFYKEDGGDADSTAVVISALVAAGQLDSGTIGSWSKTTSKGIVTPYGALAKFQNRSSGGIFWQAGSLPDIISTIQGIMGLSRWNFLLA